MALFFVAFIWLYLVVSYLFGYSFTTNNQLSMLLVLDFIVLIFFIVDKETVFFYKKNYVKHSNLVLISFVIVFFQIPLEYLSDNVSLNDNFFIPSPEYFFETVHVLSISFVSFLFGYIVSKKTKFVRKNKSIVSHKSTILLSLGSVLSFILYISVTEKSYFLGGYAEVKFTPVMTYSNVLYSSITVAYFIQNAVNLRDKNKCLTLKNFLLKTDIPVLITCSLYLFLVLMSGDRGLFIFMSMVCVITYMYATRVQLKLKVIAPMLILATILMGFIGIARAPFLIGASFSDKLAYVLEVKDRNPYISPATIELASSFRTANVVVSEIPNTTDYFCGSILTRELSLTFPVVSGVLKNVFYSNAPDYMETPASYVTYLIQGTSPKYGDGTSAIVDVYLDFGLGGCIVLFFLFGVSIRKMEQAVFSTEGAMSIFLLAVSVCYFAMTIRTGRASIFEPFITSFRVLIFIYLNNLFVKRLKKK